MGGVFELGLIALSQPCTTDLFNNNNNNNNNNNYNNNNNNASLVSIATYMSFRILLLNL